MQLPGDASITVLVSGGLEAEAVYSLPGDFDFDGDADLEDYSVFEICLWLSGPGIDPLFQECLDSFDFNNDNDVDLQDFAGFQEAFTG